MRILLAVVILIAPILADPCDYTCTDKGGCKTTYVGPSRPGKTSGSCFPRAFGGRCSGIPPECSDCNRVITCSGGSDDDGGNIGYNGPFYAHFSSWLNNRYDTSRPIDIYPSGGYYPRNCKFEDFDGKCLSNCFGRFSTGAKPGGVTVCGCRGNECYVDSPPKTCNLQDIDGNCLETCLGGFALSATSDGGSLCYCSGNECYVDPCTKCMATIGKCPC